MHRAALLTLTLLLTACAAAGPDESSEAATSSSSSSVSSSSLASSSSEAAAAAVPAAEGPVLEGDEWYRSERFGFAVQVPPLLESPGSCALTGVSPAEYRVTAFEDGSSVYIAPAVYGESVLRNPADPSSGYDCVRIDNTLPTVHKNTRNTLFYPYGWRMVADESISTDEQLLAFIRQWYGPGCALGAKTPSAHDGTWNVAVAGDEGDDTAEGSDCPLNFGYELKYSPAKHTAVTWKVGQDGRFNDLDKLMAETFRFE